jgi:hypothetical protein
MSARVGIVAATMAVLGLMPYTAAGQPGAGGTSPTPLTSVAAIRQLDREQAARRLPVRLRAVVTQVTATGAWIIVHDGTNGIFLLQVRELLRQRPVRVGDLLDIQGVTDPGDYAPTLVPKGYDVLGRAPLPTPLRPPYYELATGRHDSQWIETRGIVRAARLVSQTLSIDVAVPGGTLQVDFGESSPQDPARLLDALVRLRGVCGTRFTKQGQWVGVRLWVSRRRTS